MALPPEIFLYSEHKIWHLVDKNLTFFTDGLDFTCRIFFQSCYFIRGNNAWIGSMQFAKSNSYVCHLSIVREKQLFKSCQIVFEQCCLPEKPWQQGKKIKQINKIISKVYYVFYFKTKSTQNINVKYQHNENKILNCQIIKLLTSFKKTQNTKFKKPFESIKL